MVSRLGRVPGVIFVLLYVVSIFGFAGLYSVLPSRPFYHSTARYESQALEPDAAKLRSALALETRENLRAQFQTETPDIRGWKMNLSELEVTALGVQDYPTTVDIHVSMPVSYATSEGPITGWYSDILTVPMKLSAAINGTPYFFLKPSVEATSLVAGVTPQPSQSDFFRFPAGGDGPRVAAFTMTPTLYRELIGFGEGYRGFPTSVSGQYLRMLYFSAGVATSSALGDIAPLTVWARLAVTMQALTSLVLVGLFFNSLAASISRRGVS